MKNTLRINRSVASILIASSTVFIHCNALCIHFEKYQGVKEFHMLARIGSL